MAKDFFYMIERFEDGMACVTILRVDTREKVSQYETVSKGAVRSAKAEIAKLAA